MKPAIRVENLSKRYRVVTGPQGGTNATEMVTRAIKNTWRKVKTLSDPGAMEEENTFWALKDVSFEVQPGEVIGVIGRNGAGKSTLLKILSRIVEPTGGRAEFRGRMGSLLEVGTGFHPELTGRENVYLNGAVLGMSRRAIAKKFDEIVAFSEIEKFLDTPVKRYSSGMYVRLAFAVAAHLEPEILIVDEVLAVGDTAFQEKCIGQMKKTASRGRTILYVSHNLASIQQLCTRALYLRAGQIMAQGPPREVVQNYMNLSRRAENVSVRDWPDRETNGQARIVNLEVDDLVTGVHGSVAFGNDLRLTIEAEFQEPVQDPGFGMIVHSVEGEPMLDLRSSHSDVRLGRVNGRMTMSVTVKRLGLHPGQYLLSPWIMDATCTEDLDYAKHCSTLRVDPGQGEGRTPRLNPEYGRYWVPSDWCQM